MVEIGSVQANMIDVESRILIHQMSTLTGRLKKFFRKTKPISDEM